MKTETLVAFREKENIVAEIDKAAEKQGLDRSAFIRQAVRVALFGPGWIFEEAQQSVQAFARTVENMKRDTEKLLQKAGEKNGE